MLQLFTHLQNKGRVMVGTKNWEVGVNRTDSFML